MKKALVLLSISTLIAGISPSCRHKDTETVPQPGSTTTPQLAPPEAKDANQPAENFREGEEEPLPNAPTN